MWVAREMCRAPVLAETAISSAGIVYFHDTAQDLYTLEHPLTQRFLKVLERARVDMFACNQRPALKALQAVPGNCSAPKIKIYLRHPCEDCRISQAEKFCEQCLQYYCSSCSDFLHPPSTTSTVPQHTFRATACGTTCSTCSVKKPQVYCAECEEFYCFACFDTLHKRGFRAGHRAIATDQANGEIMTIEKCQECKDAMGSLNCKQCKNLFCVDCFIKCHAKGNRRNHTTFKSIVRPLCSRCETSRSTLFCEQCTELFCSTCFGTAHAKGSRQLHLFRDAMNFHLLLEIADNQPFMEVARRKVLDSLAKIQARVRGWLVRSQYRRKVDVVVKIQRRWRGANTRKKLQSMLEQLKWRKRQLGTTRSPAANRFAGVARKQLAVKSAVETVANLRSAVLSSAEANPLEDHVKTNQLLIEKETEAKRALYRLGNDDTGRVLRAPGSR